MDSLEYIKKNWDNLSISEISRQTKIPDYTVRRYAIKMGLPTKRNTFTSVLEAHRFTPPENWKDGWLKTDEASIRIVNQENKINYDDIREEMISEIKAYAPKFKKIKREKTEPHLLVIDPADIHINKLSLDEETGDEYNIKIALERVHKAIDKIVERSEAYKIELIMLCIGNDVLHTDNRSGTTAGTPQDMDTLWHRAFKTARQMYVDIIEQLVEKANVHIVFNPSNHDYYAGFMLADALFCWFHKHPNITWDINIRHRKYMKYGKNLIGTSHGDSGKVDDMPMLMATEAKEHWATTDFRYILLHHVHHKRQLKYLVGVDKQQITIEYMRSPSGADAWHSKNGYVSPKSIEGFVYHKDDGQVARLSVNF
jgi:hypothetical protein